MEELIRLRARVRWLEDMAGGVIYACRHGFSTDELAENIDWLEYAVQNPDVGSAAPGTQPGRVDESPA
jgi:hypothetical protein